MIAAGYPLSFKQNDVKIHGHSVEYRVYAEDPSRKFLPSIGFLRKYKEPSPDDNIITDTRKQDGSVISMQYDPFISKVYFWDMDPKEATDLGAMTMDA